MKQLPLFKISAHIVVMEKPTMIIHKKLWKILESENPRQYEFRDFGSPENYKSFKKKNLSNSIVAVAYDGKEILGFATLSFSRYRKHPKNNKVLLDVWVRPRYRQMGFGDMLVKALNQECLELTATFPDGHNKAYTDNPYAKKVKQKEREAYEESSLHEEHPSYYYDRLYSKEQLRLFSNHDMKCLAKETIQKRMFNLMNAGVDATMLRELLDNYSLRRVDLQLQFPDAPRY